MTSGTGTAPQQTSTPPASTTAAGARAAQPETVGDYIARIVAAAPRITRDHPAAECLIQLFKEYEADEPAKRKTA